MHLTDRTPSPQSDTYLCFTEDSNEDTIDTSDTEPDPIVYISGGRLANIDPYAEHIPGKQHVPVCRLI